MLGLNVVLIIVSSLLVLYQVCGDEVQDQPYYFMLFEEATRQAYNVVGFSVSNADQSISKTVLNLQTLCREANEVISIDLIKLAATEEQQAFLESAEDERVILDTFVVDNCKFDDVTDSFYPDLQPSNTKESGSGKNEDKELQSIVFIDTNGKCHRRIYTITNKAEYGLVVERSIVVADVGCPQQMIPEGEVGQPQKGVVKSWSPDGSALMPSADEEPGEEATQKQIVDFPGAPGYTLLCRAVGTKNAEKDENKNKHITVTIQHDGKPLGRFKLMDEACSFENITPTNGGSDEKKVRMITTSGSGRREYTLSIEIKKEYNKVTLIGNSNGKQLNQ